MYCGPCTTFARWLGSGTNRCASVRGAMSAPRSDARGHDPEEIPMNKHSVLASILISLAAAAIPGCMAEPTSPEESGNPAAEPTTGEASRGDADTAAEEDVGEAASAASTSCCGSQRVCDPPPPCYPVWQCSGSPFPTCKWVTYCPPQNCYDAPLPCPLCLHSACTEGRPLNGACDPIVALICAADPYCCNTWWDGQCVAEVGSIAHRSCNGCN